MSEVAPLPVTPASKMNGNGNGNGSPDLLSGIKGWPKVVAYLGVLGLFASVMAYQVVYLMPKMQADCLHEQTLERSQRERDQQHLVDTLTTNQKELTQALDANRQAVDALRLELLKARLAKPELELVPSVKKE